MTVSTLFVLQRADFNLLKLDFATFRKKEQPPAPQAISAGDQGAPIVNTDVQNPPLCDQFD
jgi:hypothetical protein